MNKDTVSRLPIIGAVIGAVITAGLYFYFVLMVSFSPEFFIPACFFMFIPVLVGAAIGVLIGGVTKEIITKKNGWDAS